jgi:hypothetical protein
MAQSIRRSTDTKPGTLYSFLLIAAFVVITFLAFQPFEKRIEPAGIHATAHEHGMPLLGTLAGG